MVKSHHPTHISIPSQPPTQSPDDDVDMAYDGPLGSPPSGQNNEIMEDDEQEHGEEKKREVPESARTYGSIKPRGILKNAPGRVDAEGREIPAGDHLTWDEEKLALTEIQKDSQMKIDEPKTPFVKSEQLGDLPLNDVPDFELSGSGAPVSPTGKSTSHSTDEAAIIAANTRYNAQLGHLTIPTKSPESPFTSSTPFPSGEGIQTAEPTNDVQRERTPSFSSNQVSRSASFSLPDVKSGKMVRRPSTSASIGAGDEVVEEDDEGDDEANMDPETLKKHREFKARRKGHYSNEAEAMRKAQSLIAQEDDDEE